MPRESKTRERTARTHKTVSKTARTKREAPETARTKREAPETARAKREAPETARTKREALETARTKRAALETARTAARLALEKKAEDVVILDLRELSLVCDYFVVASGRSETQVKAVAESVEEGLAAQGAKPWHREGYAGRRWILLDFVDVVVHVFHRETREFYLLERLWGDAPVESIDE